MGRFENKVDQLIVRGDYAYAKDDDTLKVLDISDRARLMEIGQVALPCRIAGLKIAADYAYVNCSNESLVVVSLSDLNHPTVVGRYDLEDFVWLTHTAIAGHYAYLATFSSLYILDISDPISPTQVGLYPEPHLRYTTLVDNYAFTTGFSGLYILDISDPISPSLVGRYHQPYGSSPAQAIVAGNYLYLPDQDHGLQTFDISNPARPIRVKANLRQQRVVSITQDYLYVTGRDGLQVMDISNPADPVEINSFDLPPEAGTIIEGDYAYILERQPFSVRVLDISDPTAPTELGSYHMPESAYVLALVDDYIYVGDGEGRLFILQFTLEKSVGGG